MRTTRRQAGPESSIPQQRAPISRSVPARLINRGYWLIWLIPGLLVCIGWQFTGTTTLDIGSDGDQAVVEGFYEPERNASDTYRWSRPTAALILPANHLPGVLELRGALAPDGTRVVLAPGAGGEVRLPPGAATLTVRRYHLLLPTDADALGMVRVGITTHLPAQTVEARRIGMALMDVRIRSVAGAWQPPPAVPLLILGVVPVLLNWGLGLGGVGRRSRQGLSLAIASALVLLWVWQPLGVRPFLLDVLAFAGEQALLRWWLAVQVLGLLTLPLTAFLFRHLPLRGYPFSKALGLLLVSYGSWLLALLRLVPFGLPGVLLVALFVALLGWWAVRREPWRMLWAGAWSRRRAVLACELLFTAALCAGLWLRWHGATGPAISGTEKPMDLAFLSGILQSTSFPPQDPWLAGYAINYYYLGYVTVAVLKLISGVSVGEAFNLGVATAFALTALMVAGLVLSLIEMTARAERSQPGRLGKTAAALLGVVLVLVAGNQMGALQVLVGSSQVRALDGAQLLEALGQRLGGAEVIRLSRPTPQTTTFGSVSVITPTQHLPFDWWTPSRAIWDEVEIAPGEVVRRHAITEFPFFSFYLGELHPHVTVLPFAALALGLVLAVVTRPRPPAFFSRATGWLEVMLTGIMLGSLYAINSWYAPTCLLLYAGALALLYRRLAQDEGRVFAWWSAVRTLAGVAVATLLLLLPFLLTFQPPSVNRPAPPAWASVPLLQSLGMIIAPSPDQTRLYAFLVMFGLFFVVLLAYALTRHPAGPHTRLLGLGLTLALLIGLALDFPLLVLPVFAAALAWRAWMQAQSPAQAFVCWAAAAGTLIIFVPDLVYIRDYLEDTMSRMNTIFKFYYQAWLIWGVLAAYAIWALLRPPFLRRGVTPLWVAPAALLLIGTLVYPVGALAWGEPWGTRARVSDGLAFLRQRAPDELAAINWLRKNAAPDAIVLTAFCDCDYDEIGRVAAVTGRPTLLGWSFGHERLWRSGAPAILEEIAARERDVPLIYTTTDVAEARRLLAQYNVRYVYVGPTERRIYAGPGVAKFDRLLDLVFQQGQARIYRRR